MLRQSDASWANPKVLTIFALIFLCGIAVGSVVTSSFLHTRFQHLALHAQAARQLGLDGLETKLQLTPDQQRIVTEVVDDYAKYYQNIQEDIEEQRHDVAEHGKRRIWEVLNPDQRQRFLELFKAPPAGVAQETK